MDNEFSPLTNAPAPLPASRSSRWVATAVLVVVVGLASFGGGLSLGRRGYTFSPKQFQVVNQNNVPGTVDYNLLWQTITDLKQNYLEPASINDQNILYGAVKGAVASVGDPYTEFFDPDDLKNFDTRLSGSFGGIGAEVGKQDGNIVIIAPLKDTPAAQAGLRARDIIVQVDGKATQDMGVQEVVNAIRGPKGTAVTLTIFRQGQDKPFDVKIVRDTILIKSVEVAFKEQNGKKIAVITLSEFGDDTVAAFQRAVNQVLSAKPAGLVIDLRNNPGGYLNAAVEVASQWVAKDKIVVTEAHGGSQNIPYNSKGYELLGKYRTVVLINGGSASAAEILSGALHDYRFATLVGEKSFGKGSVQQLIDLPGSTALKVTIAKWITPGGKNLNKNGLDPDIAVKLNDSDILAGKDPQMDRALQEAAK